MTANNLDQPEAGLAGARSASPLSPARRWRNSAHVIRRLGYVALWAVLVCAGVVAWPVQFGGDTGYTIVSGHSMNPVYHTGDLLITRPQIRYHRGQIVVYRVPHGEPAAGMFIVHRLVAGSGRAGGPGWTTQGDNNPSTDIWTPHDSDIQGAVVLNVAQAGYVMRQTRDPLLYCLVGSLVIGRMLWPTRSRDQKPAEPTENL